MNVAVVGCGNISLPYARSILAAPQLELFGATDAVPGRADALVAEVGGASYPSVDALLADPRVDLVVNLTPARAHAAVTRAGLEAGKHVYSEKPLALTYEEARELVELAAERGVRLGCAPSTLLGEAQQTAWKLVRDGAIGRVRVVYADANWGRIESWHPAPLTLYAVGPAVDVGVYPLTMATAMFGPAEHVVAYATTVEPERTARDGSSFRSEAPDFVVAALDLAGGVVVRLTASFYVGPSKQRGLEFHGDRGSLHLPTWGEANSRVELQERGGEYAPVPLVRPPFEGIDWSRAIVDLAEAVEEGRPHRAHGTQAAHVVEILCAIAASSSNGAPVAIASRFEPPPPMEWAQ